MTGRLSNETIKSFILKNVIKEYRRFILGSNNSLLGSSHLISNSFFSFKGTGITNLGDELSDSWEQIADGFKPKGILDDSDETLQRIKDNYIFDMLDNSYSSFFLKNIIQGDAFKNPTPDNKSNYFLVVHEPLKELPADNSFLVKDFSIKAMVSSIKNEDITKLPDSENNDQNQTITENQIKRPLARSYTMTTGSLYINPDLNKNTNNEPDRLNPSLGAIVIKKHGIGCPARNSEHLNIFFNAIPSLEMSRCTPYIDITIVTRAEENLPKNINNVTFMRFLKKEKTGDFILDENIGLSSAKPFGFDTILGIDEYSLENNLDVSMMDIFTSPQVMANANINTDIKYINGIYSHEVLEPISPFLSLSDLSIDVSGMGIALFSSKVGSMNLKLHDRSRLSDISHLISPESFGNTKMIIEFGWSHPEGNISNENIIGQFLNSLRDRSVYTVKTSNFSFSEGNIVNIGLTLACYGEQHITNVSASVGRLIPAKIFKSGIKKIIEETGKKLIGDNLDKLKVKEVRNIMKVELRNATNDQNLIDFKTYEKIVKSFEQYRLLKNDISKKEVLSNIKLIVDPESIKTEKNKEEIEKIKANQKNTINQLMFEKIYALNNKSIKPNFLNDKFLTSYDNKIGETPVDKAELLNKFLPNPDEFVSLGQLFMSFIGYPMAMSGVFDEVQLVFYPLNMHAGGACIYTTASMPIEFSIIQNVLTEKLSSVTDINVKGFFNLIESKIIRDRSLTVYGISEIIRENNNKIEAAKKEELYLTAKKQIEKYETEKNTNLQNYITEQRSIFISDTAGLSDDIQSELNQKKEKYETFQQNISNKENELKSKFESDTAKFQNDIDQTNKKIKGLKEELDKNIGKKLAQLYSEASSDIRENKFVRPNLSLYMETLTHRDPNTSIYDAAYDIASIANGGWKAAVSQIGFNMLADSSKQSKKTICRVHIYDENASANPRKRMIQSIMTEGNYTEIIKKGKKINIENLMKEHGLNTASKIKRFVKNSYPSITYGANNSTVHGISVTSNVSDQVSQVIQISSYAKRNKQQGNTSTTNDFEEITVVPSTVSLRMMGNPLITRGNEIYIDFGTNTTLDNIYVVKSVSHKISNGNFETDVSLIYSGQGDTKSIANDIKSAILKGTNNDE